MTRSRNTPGDRPSPPDGDCGRVRLVMLPAMPWRMLAVCAPLGGLVGAIVGFIRGLQHLPTRPFAIIEGAILFGVPASLLGVLLVGWWSMVRSVRQYFAQRGIGGTYSPLPLLDGYFLTNPNYPLLTADDPDCTLNPARIMPSFPWEQGGLGDVWQFVGPEHPPSAIAASRRTTRNCIASVTGPRS